MPTCTSLLTTGLLSLAAPLATGLVAAERPNFLCVVSEDSVRYLGCYGDTVARTPALDALARDGVLFEHCYTSPVCAPSRFGLITGLHAASCGPANQMRAVGNPPAWARGLPGLLREAGYYTTNSSKTDYNAQISIAATWDDSGKTAHWRNRPAGKPFFAVFNFVQTHESCLHGPTNPAGRFAGSTDPARVLLPPYLPDTPEMRSDLARLYDCVAAMDEAVGQHLQQLADAGLAEDTVVIYYGDNGGVMPRSKRFLYDSGTRVPFIMRVPAKWRALAPGDPGTRSARLVHFVDIGPTVLSMAGVPVPSALHGQPIAGSQAAPPRSHVLVARDRMDAIQDMSRGIKDGRFSYLRNYMPQIPYGQHVEYMFKAAGYRNWRSLHEAGGLPAEQEAFWQAKPAEELYDTVADPHEMRNLAGDPAHAADLARLRAALRAELLAINDNGFMPESSPLQGYEASRDPVAYPLGRVLDLADLAIRRDPANLPAFVTALSDPAEAVRYWGALGCTLLGSGATPAAERLVAAAADPLPGVRLAAAEALCHLGRTADGLPVLTQALTDATVEVRLHAANILVRLGPAARPALPAMKAALTTEHPKTGGRPDGLLRYPLEALRPAVARLEADPDRTAPSGQPGQGIR